MRRGFASALAVVLAAGGAEAITAPVPQEGMIDAGIGGGAFTRDLGDITGGGLSWDARAGVNFNPFLGGEVQYQGLRGDVDTIAQAGGGIVLRGENITQHQVTADTVVGVPFLLRNDHTLKPYGTLGIGYSRINTNARLAGVGLDSDNQVAIPLGFGATYELMPGIVVDGRFTYNFLGDVELPLAADNASSWNALVSIGARIGR